ncbi:hypothetical protein ACWXVP_02495 [Mycoplasma sp. 1781]
MKKKTKIALIGALVPTVVIGAPLLGFSIYSVITHLDRLNMPIGPSMPHRNYLEDVTLYKDAFKGDNILIKNPFKKYEFKTSNKIEEVKKYINSIKKEGFYVIPLKIKLINTSKDNKGDFREEFEEKISNLKDIVLFYLPKKMITQFLPYGFEFEQWYATPFQDLEDFKIFKTSSEDTYKDVTNWKKTIHSPYPSFLQTRSFLSAINKHKVKYNDKELDIADIIIIGIDNDKKDATLKIFINRYIPSDYSKIKEYEELEAKDGSEKEINIYNLHY